jgi:hypothetical protein
VRHHHWRKIKQMMTVFLVLSRILLGNLSLFFVVSYTSNFSVHELLATRRLLSTKPLQIFQNQFLIQNLW